MDHDPVSKLKSQVVHTLTSGYQAPFETAHQVARQLGEYLAMGRLEMLHGLAPRAGPLRLSEEANYQMAEE